MDDLIGKVVMVHPTLTYDPVKMQGETGTITHINPESDDVYVRFQNGKLGLYSADALLILTPARELIENLRDENSTLDRSDILEIFQIYLLQASENFEYEKEALEMAVAKPGIYFAIIRPLHDWIIRNQNNQDQFTGFHRGR